LFTLSREYFLIEGGYPLKGIVHLQGAKNAALPLFAATILCEGRVTFRNIPLVNDIITMLSLLEYLGLEVNIDRKNKSVTIENRGIKSYSAPLSYIRKMRASIYVLGPLITVLGKAKIAIPGGCAFGPRPINFHLKGLKKMGVKININGGFINAEAKDLKGIHIKLPKISVGATAHLAMTAAKIEDESVIENISLEPEVMLLFEFLKKCGVSIKVDKRKLYIRGKKNLKSPNLFDNIPDRIEAGTYMLFVSGTGGELILKPNPIKYLEKFTKVLRKTGVYVEDKKEYLYLKKEKEEDLEPLNVTTSPYPGYPTDLQPQLVALLTQAKGKSSVRERVYPERFGYVGELVKMGADIEVSNGVAKIKGKSELKGAPLIASDIRAGASIILASLIARGKSKIYEIEHIKRGYEKIVYKLRKLGAKIEIKRG